MRIRKIYPRGYQVLEDVPGYQHISADIVETEGNKDVTTLYTDYLINSHNRITGFEAVTQAVNLAHLLIGKSLGEWYSNNLKNEYLNNNALTFLEDTINFIVTGRRRMTIESWFLVLNTKAVIDREPRLKIKSYDELINIGGKRLFKEKNYVSQWLSHPNGLCDLILSLMFIFGEVKERAIIAKVPYNRDLHRAMYGLNTGAR